MQIKKSSGETEEFSESKLSKSLKASGASEVIIKDVAGYIEGSLKPGMTTDEIHKKASRKLAGHSTNLAAKYNLRRGLSMLGPDGFLFEKYLEALLSADGYKTERNIYMEGECVPHEIDIVAHKNSLHYLVEAKYHNKHHIKTHIDVVMYAYARLLDIGPAQLEREGDEFAKHKMWLVTNTKFTSKAVKYAKCKNIKLMGWSYPKKDSLQKIITDNNLYPISTLPSIDPGTLRHLSEKGVLLVKDLDGLSAEDLERKFSLSREDSQSLADEVHQCLVANSHE